MDACVGSASVSAAFDRWRTYRLHGDRKLGSMEFLLNLLIQQ